MRRNSVELGITQLFEQKTFVLVHFTISSYYGNNRIRDIKPKTKNSRSYLETAFRMPLLANVQTLDSVTVKIYNRLYGLMRIFDG